MNGDRPHRKGDQEVQRNRMKCQSMEHGANTSYLHQIRSSARGKLDKRGTAEGQVSMAYRGFTIGSRHTGVNCEQCHRISPFRKGEFLLRSIACKHPIPGPGQDDCSTKTGQRQSLQHSPPQSCGVGGDDLQWLADGTISGKKKNKTLNTTGICREERHTGRLKMGKAEAA